MSRISGLWAWPCSIPGMHRHYPDGVTEVFPDPVALGGGIPARSRKMKSLTRPGFTIGCLSASVPALNRSAASGRKDQFLKKSGYCITSVASRRPIFADAGVEIESDAHLLAIDTKMAFTVVSLLLGIGQGHRHGYGGADMVIR
jgi:hypothetical protein